MHTPILDVYKKCCEDLGYTNVYGEDQDALLIAHNIPMHPNVDNFHHENEQLTYRFMIGVHNTVAEDDQLPLLQAIGDCLSFEFFTYSLCVFMNKSLCLGPEDYSSDAFYQKHQLNKVFEKKDAYTIVDTAYRLRWLLLLLGDYDQLHSYLTSHPQNYYCRDDWLSLWESDDLYVAPTDDEDDYDQ